MSSVTRTTVTAAPAATPPAGAHATRTGFAIRLTGTDVPVAGISAVHAAFRHERVAVPHAD